MTKLFSRSAHNKVGAFCHIFYPELTDEILAHLVHVPGNVDILVSTDTDEKAHLIAATLKTWPKGDVQITVLPNRGRDIAPRMTVYRYRHDRYDLVVYIHSKRGRFVVDGDEWRKYLFNRLLGSPAIVRENLRRFKEDAQLGVLFSQHWPPIKPFIGWGANAPGATALAIRMGLTALGETVEFPSGSMFWARPAALRPLLDLGLTIQDFEPELGQIDGTQAHAIERMFLMSCECAGFRWAMIGGGTSGSTSAGYLTPPRVKPPAR